MDHHSSSSSQENLSRLDRLDKGIGDLAAAVIDHAVAPFFTRIGNIIGEAALSDVERAQIRALKHVDHAHDGHHASPFETRSISL